MKSTLLLAHERGHLNFGWLDTYHSFSFGEYYNPQRTHFGALRVVNDDLIHPQSMFPPHPHNDMEIITVVLSGTIEHTDSLGNKAQIQAGEIQVMSAGSGIVHSEANPSSTTDLELFQIWIFPRAKNLTPRYDQRNFSQQLQQTNCWHLLVTPNGDNEQLLINQDAFLSLASFTPTEDNYQYQPQVMTNGIFIMVINGTIEIAGQQLNRRDAIMLTAVDGPIQFKVKDNSQLLAIEVPLTI